MTVFCDPAFGSSSATEKGDMALLDVVFHDISLICRLVRNMIPPESYHSLEGQVHEVSR